MGSRLPPRTSPDWALLGASRLGSTTIAPVGQGASATPRSGLEVAPGAAKVPQRRAWGVTGRRPMNSCRSITRARLGQMGVLAGGDSVGWANLGDYLERIIDLDGLVAPVHHTSCIAHGGARGPSSAPAVTRKEARRRLTNGRTPTPSLPSAPTDHKGVPQTVC